MSLVRSPLAPFSDVPHRRPTIHDVVRLLAQREGDGQWSRRGPPELHKWPTLTVVAARTRWQSQSHVFVRLQLARLPRRVCKQLRLRLHDMARGWVVLRRAFCVCLALRGLHAPSGRRRSKRRLRYAACVVRCCLLDVFALFKQWHGPRRRDPVRLAQHPREVVLHETLPYPCGHQHVPFDQEHEVRPCLLDGEVAKGIDGKQRLYNRGENIGQHIGQQSLVMIVLSLPHHAHLHSSHTSTRFQLNGSPPFPSLPWPGPPPRHEGRHAS